MLWILACAGGGAICVLIGFVAGMLVADAIAVRDGRLTHHGIVYRVIRETLATAPFDNLGTRIRALIEAGTFDAQIARAIKRNEARKGS